MHLSLTRSPHFVYIYINNCFHVQCLPLNEKRTSVVTVGMQVLRISAISARCSSFPLLEYFFLLWAAKKKKKTKDDK